MKIVLMGPPGAGKGTLAGLLKDSLGLEHISAGDILREEMKNQTELGLEMKRYVEDGNLVPDEAITKLIEHRISDKALLEKGFMLDGYPRTKKQAEDLDGILSRLESTLDCSLYMDASLPIILKRLTGRRVCRKCGSLFHIKNKPPAKEGTCNVCGGELYQRPDDNEETIKTRMEVYFENTNPIIEHYQEQGKLIKLNGDQESTEVEAHLKLLFDEDGRFNQNKVQR